MSQMGQKLPQQPRNATSALPRSTDINRPAGMVRFVPIGDICSPAEVFPRPASAERGFIFLAARNLYAAHLLVCVAAEPENGSRLRKPRGVMPERLFHAGRAVSLSAHQQAPRFGTKADEAFSETAI